MAHVAAGIKKQPCKTKMFHSKVEYLRNKISKRGVSMIPKYEQKIKDWPLQKTGKEVDTFLGFARYFRTFIPQYSVLTNWLNGILWNEEIEQHFIELKKAFTEGGIQAFPNIGVGDSFILIKDWNKENITGVLSQVQGEQERLLGC